MKIHGHESTKIDNGYCLGIVFGEPQTKIGNWLIHIHILRKWPFILVREVSRYFEPSGNIIFTKPGKYVFATELEKDFPLFEQYGFLLFKTYIYNKQSV